ncbi:MAG: M4 family metallopeptidase [Christiangramia sp.]|nr:M4 family metallopeptidase [Christiangramia sp.]
MKHFLKFKLKFYLTFFLLANFSLTAQITTSEITSNLENDPRVKSFVIDTGRGTPSLIKLETSKDQLSVSEAPTFLKEIIGSGAETEFIQENSVNSHGIEIYSFQQYLKGIKVEHGIFKAVTKNGVITAFTSEYYNLPDTFVTTTSISEEAALQEALDFVGAEQYSWEYIQSLGSGPEITEAYNQFYPAGKLVIVDDYSTSEVDPKIAYKFNIYAAEPISRADIYVDGNSGEILLEDKIIKHANSSSKKEIRKTLEKSKQYKGATSVNVPFLAGTGDTRYAGRRNFDTSQDTDGNYILKGVTPSGIENETLSYEGIGGLPLSIPALQTLAVPVVDGDGDLLNPETADNIWNEEEHRKDEFSTTSIYPIANEKNNDDVALDAHWGAEVVLDYWKNIHDRLSYDNQGTKVFNYVHYGEAYDNAFWNGTAMTYGDGSYQGGTNPDGTFAPLTSMDVCAHEIAHGVCEFTADLVYQRESGAMNEGFSDIWAASVENYVLSRIDSGLNYDTWGIGEQIDESDGGLPPGDPDSRALRWMDSPKSEGNPDSYGGENWTDPECGTPTLANDQCGVHNNSGVLNKWYYLMVSGSGQSLSPGFNKPAVEDQVTDAGNTYFVEGLGFAKADNIAYLAETMLSPNAKFADMREASILAAQTLYGIGSFEEEQTTNSWYGVDVGDKFNAGEPNTITFSDSNIQIFSEDNELNGCEDFNTFSVVLTSVDIDPTASISLSTSGSTATEGSDFDISASSLSFTGSETKTIDINVYDDALIEDSESIVLSFVYNGEFIKQEYAISDNDFEPRTGNQEFDLLATETFENDGLPAQWTTVKLGEGVNVWKINGDLTAAGRAYISDGLTEIPFYDQNSPSNTILRSPLLNAAAASNVTVSFDWEAGGETDAVDPEIIFDYGEFVYSLDGANYTSVKKFVGTGPLAVNTASGSFSAVFNELDGQAFYLGWRWYNDTNAGTEFSFAIDNVKVSAIPAGIETQKGEQATAGVEPGNTIYFLSNTDKALIAKIENATEDLGCVNMEIVDAGSSFKVFPDISTARPSKVFRINVENQNAQYDLTLYFTDEELSAFDSTTDLIPLKVNSSNIDEANERDANFQLNGTVTDVNTGDAYTAYTGTFTGSGTLSVVQDFDYCTPPPSPWKTTDVGTVQSPGEICYINDHFEVTGSGNGFSEKSDSFYFTYQEITGDAEIIARLNSFDNAGTSGKAAVMIRNGLDAGSKMAGTVIAANPDFNGPEARFEYRKAAGTNTSASEYQPAALPEYFRIVKEGDNVSSFVSDSNGNWILIGTNKIKFQETIYVGLAVTSGTNTTSTLADFNEVVINQGQQITTKSADPQLKTTSTQQETNEASKFTLYPNPATNWVTLEVSDSAIQLVTIYGLNGQMLKRIEVDAPASKTKVEVSDLLHGLYIMKIYTTDDQILNQRFLKK